ncbi:MAG: orotate phosphoribosyltransferase [Candidatus Cloacimonas sp.]|jgi:orotate phosphoribosyltransferase|nr:orotate phosphoribosyltransferase [Candidatus Cloacimonas sp.]
MDAITMVTIASYTNPFEAELAKSLLEDFGFAAVLLNERMMSMYSSIAGDMYMIELQVPSDVEDEAKRILTGLEDSDYITRILSSESALLEGHFQLTSGKHSQKYIEKIRVFQNPEATHNLCKRMATRLEGYEFDAIVGPAYGGIVLAFETAYLMGKSFLFTQRKDGEMCFRSGFDLSEIKRVAIIEDILTTGGSINEVISCLQERCLDIAVIGVLVDRSGGKLEFPAPLESLLYLDIPAFEAEECPMCKEGIPLVKPGSSDK